MSLVAALQAAQGLSSPKPGQDRYLGRGTVENSPDLERILALPRRTPPSLEQQTVMAAKMSAFLRIPDQEEGTCQCHIIRKAPKYDPSLCISALFPIQGWYLWEASQIGGAVGHIRVGGGKSLIDALLCICRPRLDRPAVLLIPPGLRRDFAKEFALIAQHFRVPNLAGGTGMFYPDRPTLHVQTYSMLSHKNQAVWLKTVNPYMIIADEAQKLKSYKTAIVKRFVKYIIEQPDTEFYAHSGTLTTRSLKDYGHLSAISLKEKSPLPIEAHVTEQWAAALDPVPAGGLPSSSGALRRFCGVGENARSGFRRRLLDTKGVVASEAAQLPIRLRIVERKIAVPESVRSLLRQVRSSQARPDGEEFTEATEVVGCLRQVACGFYLRWKYPRGEPVELIEDWFKKRQAFNKELRNKLQGGKDYLDSPGHCKDAARRHYANYKGQLPTWHAEHWPAWEKIEKAVYHESEAVWIDDFLVRDVSEWAKRPGIVWVGHPALGEAVARNAGVPYYGEGDKAAAGILAEQGGRSIVASIKAHGTGRNLQYAFSRNLICNIPDGGSVEQLIGRTHRHGQKAEEVTVEVYQHTEEVVRAYETALGQAQYVRDTTGSSQKLLYAGETGS